MPIQPQTIGLAGVAQVLRIEHHVQHLRKGQVVKKTDETHFAVTSFLPEEAGPKQCLQLNREHWSIENGQFHRRDRTQREDWCRVGGSEAARNLSLFRSLAIFLFKTQPPGRGRKESLPDFQQHIHRKPWGSIQRLTQAPREK